MVVSMSEVNTNRCDIPFSDISLIQDTCYTQDSITPHNKKGGWFA